MKRAIVTSVRISKDTKTSEDNVWITMSIMPSKMSNGNLFYPKTSDISVSTCAGAIRTSDRFTKYKDFKLGDVVNIHYNFNEYTQKLFIEDIELVLQSPYSENDLIV